MAARRQVVATEFKQKNIGLPSSAPWHMNRTERAPNGNQQLPIVFRCDRLGCGMWMSVPEGFKAIVSIYGRHLGVWQSGWHFAPPWVEIPFMISKAHFVYDTPVKECPTADNVMVTIDITLVVRVITDAGQDGKHSKIFAFCDNLGAVQLSQQLNAFQEEAVRNMARARLYHEIYDLMDAQHDKQLENTRKSLNNHFNRYGIEITEIAVTNVHFNNTSIADDMAQPAIYKQKEQFDKLEQAYQIKQIHIKEKEHKERQLKKEDLEKFEASLQKEAEEKMAKLNKIRADTSKILANIREEERADVLRVKSESDLEVAKIKALTKVELAKIKSEGRAEAEAVTVETTYSVEKMKAQMTAEVAKNTAISLNKQATAEAQAVKDLAPRREYDAKFRHLRILKGLADNHRVSIAGSNGDNVVAQLVANQNGGTVLGVNVN